MFKFDIQKFAGSGGDYQISAGSWYQAYVDGDGGAPSPEVPGELDEPEPSSSERADFEFTRATYGDRCCYGYVAQDFTYYGGHSNAIPPISETNEYIPLLIYSDNITFGAGGNASTVTISNYSGEISGLTVMGDTKTSLSVVIGDKTYSVNSAGKLVEAAADEPAEVVVQTTVINQTKRADGKIVSKSYPFINPAATSEQIATFINALNELTENTKEKIIRVDKTEIG